MADGYDGYEECAPRPKPQDFIDKLKSAGIPTGQAITINHVVKMSENAAYNRAFEDVNSLRAEFEVFKGKCESEGKNSTTGRYIVTVALACFAAVGFIAGKVFG